MEQRRLCWREERFNKGRLLVLTTERRYSDLLWNYFWSVACSGHVHTSMLSMAK